MPYFWGLWQGFGFYFDAVAACSSYLCNFELSVLRFYIRHGYFSRHLDDHAAFDWAMSSSTVV